MKFSYKTELTKQSTLFLNMNYFSKHLNTINETSSKKLVDMKFVESYYDSTGVSSINKSVATYVKQGYVPCGNMVTTPSPINPAYKYLIQPMCKYEDQER